MFIVSPIVCGVSVFSPCFVIRTLCLSSFAIILMRKTELSLSCVAITVFLISCDSQCSVALPHGAVGWSAVCDCAIPDHTHLYFMLKRTRLVGYSIHRPTQTGIIPLYEFSLIDKVPFRRFLYTKG